jgi:SAM-dependent methyltransferase
MLDKTVQEFSNSESREGEAAASCVVCGGGHLLRLTAAGGDQLHCTTCFHAWRPDFPDYPYADTPMCSHPMGRDRYESQVDFFSPYAPAGCAILELGCATGELAAITRELVQVGRFDGVEMSPSREVAKAHLDILYEEPLTVLLGKGLIDRTYDLVLMSHVLEHLDDPAAEIRAIKQIIGENGAVFLEVPNRSGNPRLPIDDNVCHIHFFSLSSITRMLANEGLETVAARTGVRLDARCTDALQVIARPFRLPAWSKTMLSDHPMIAGEESVVAWGAGGLAQVLLANYFDPARIEFFVDQNPAKQGALCLGRPILGPEALAGGPRTILINSVDFADAIAADIERLQPGVTHRIIRVADLL